jgi:hypothetical protein
MRLTGSLLAVMLAGGAGSLAAQVQIRIDDSTRTWYSELHEGLRPGTGAADSVRRVLAERRPARLWRVARKALVGKARWDDAVLAFTRLAELRDRASVDTASRWLAEADEGSLVVSGDFDPGYMVGPLNAIRLEYTRRTRTDLEMLADLLGRVPSGRYNLGDAWVFGRLGSGAADTVARRFLETTDRNLRMRYLSLLSFSTDTSLIPLLGRIYAAPDSFDLPPRIGVRASDGLLWIGTRRAIETLAEARERARARGVYADPRLGANDLDFLANDSATVVARTGLWLTEWLDRLKE